MDERAVRAEHEALHNTIAANQKPQLAKIETEGLEKTFAIVPKGMEIKSLKDIQDDYRLVPLYVNQAEATNNFDSFIVYVKRYLSENSILFADQPKIDGNRAEFTMKAILDYHPAGGDPMKAGAGNHTMQYIAALHTRMSRWLKTENRGLSQIEFASFVEDNIGDLCVLEGFTPPFGSAIASPADLLTLSRGLEVRVNQTVRNASRLSNGETSLIFTSENTKQDGSELIVPEWFGIKLPIFIGTEPTIIPVRLRYRVKDGVIVFTYLFHGFDMVLEQTVAAAVEHVRKNVPTLAVIEGLTEVTY